MIVVGFDGVEVYGVNVYFVYEFLLFVLNICDDCYGGLLENCVCFVIEVMCVVVEVVGVDCIGICLFL